MRRRSKRPRRALPAVSSRLILPLESGIKSTAWRGVASYLLVLYSTRVVDAHNQSPGFAQLRVGSQIEQRVTRQHGGVGSIIKALAQGLNFCAQLPRCQTTIEAQRQATTGAQTQHPPADVVVRVKPIHGSVQIIIFEMLLAAKRQSSDAGLAYVVIAK